MTDHDAVIQARDAVARACGALDVAADAITRPRSRRLLRDVIAELEATGAWLRTLPAPEPDTDTITVTPNTGDAPDASDAWRWHATRRREDGGWRVAYGPTPEAAVAQLCGRVVASVDPTMLGVR